MQKSCRISIKNFEIIVKLNSTVTAQKIWHSLPVVSKTNTWGKEIYFYTSIDQKLEKSAKEIIEFGEIVYWPTGRAIAIGFGKTPLSIMDEIRLASKCNVWGYTDFDLNKLCKIVGGEQIKMERVL